MKFKTLQQVLLLSIISFSLSAQCSISNLIIEASGCDADGFVTIDIEFDVDNPGADNMFTITGNGTDYGQFEYGEDFYTIGPVEGDCVTTYEVVITDVNNNDCSESVAFGLPFCCGGCGELIVDYVGLNECTGSGTFFMDILIDHPTSESFEVYIDDIDYGTYDYGEEIYTFGPFTGDCTTTRYINVQDGSIFCEDVITVEPVCCSEYCSISDVTVEPIECTGLNQFSIELNFESTEVEEDEFDFWANGAYHGTYAYADLPLYIEDFPQELNGNNFVTVFGIGEDALCANDLAFDGLDCSSLDCAISNVYAEAYDCNDQGQIFVDIEFDVINPGTSNQFTINGNGTNYGTFEYGQTFYTVGPFTPDCEIEYEFEIQDVDNTGCSAFFIFEEALCCAEECTITNVEAEAFCTDDGLFADVWFDYDNPGASNQFMINVYGEEFGPFEYGETYYNIGPLAFPCEPFQPFDVFDIDNSDCIGSFELLVEGNECCELNTCEITTLDFGPNPECIDGNIVTEWLIDGENLSEVGFDIFINNAFITFVEWNEDSWYDFEIEDPGTELFTIKVCDNDNEDCCIEWELENPCYDGEPNECSITNVEAEAFCTDDGLFADVWFEYENPGASNQFTIEVWGEEFGPFEYGESFYNVGPLELPCEPFQPINITDIENTDCAGFFELELPEGLCCDFNDCAIVGLGAEAYDCNDDGEIYFDIFFDVVNPGDDNQFTVVGNGNNYGTFEYGQGFYTVGPFIADCETEVELIVTDVNDNDCSAFIGFDELFCCEEEECSINDLTVETSECNDGTDISITFEHIGGSGEVYITLNDDSFGPYDDIIFPITYVTFLYETEYITVSVCDAEDLNCCATVEVLNPCYNPQETCAITTLDFGPNPECVDGLIITEWLIDGENLSEVGFDIYINNLFETYVEWNEDAWYDFDIENPETEIFTIKVCDNDNDDCCYEWELENPCYEPDMEECNISEVFVEALECNDDNQVYFHLTFDYENVGDDNQFTVVGNGNNYGTFEYGLDFYEVGPVEADCETELEFIVTDVNYSDCSAFVGHEPVCCDDEEECALLELSVETTECFEDNTFDITVDVEVSGDTNDFFDLFIAGDFNGFYEFDELPLTIEDLTYDSQWILIELCENDNPDCCILYEVMNPCYEEDDGEDAECYIDDIELDNTNCIGGEVSFTIDFEYGDGNSEEFTVSGNGEDYGTFAYDDLPITLNGFEGDGTTQYEFIITDSEDETCTAEVIGAPVDCNPQELVDFGESQTSLKSLADQLDLRIQDDIISIDVFDLNGHKICTGKDFSNLIHVDRSVFAGILILRIETSTQVIVKKIVRVN